VLLFTATLTTTPTATSTQTSTPTVTPTRGPVFLPIVFGPLPTPTTVVVNGGFENGLTGWQSGGQLGASADTNPADAHSDSESVLLGNPTYNANCGNGGIPVDSAYVSQIVTLPNVSAITLTFWYHMYTQDWTGSDLNQPKYDSFSVGIGSPSEIGGVFYAGNTNLQAAKLCNGPLLDLHWNEGTVDLSRYRGQTITLYFANWNSGTSFWNTYTYLDDVAISSSN
jgi:hypothetical protein